MMIGEKNRIEAIIAARDEASKKMEGVAQSAEEMSRRVRNSGIIIAGAGVAILSAIGGTAYKFGAMAGDIQKMAAQTGLSTDEFQRMKYAVEQNEGSVENLVMGMTMLRKRSVEAAGGSKTAAEEFDKLDVSFQNAADGSVRKTLDILLDLADVMAKYKDDPEVMATALENLGVRGGKELVPLLQLGRKGILQFMAEARGIIPEETLTKLDDFEETIKRSKTELQAIIAKGLDPILPYLNRMADHVVKIMDRLSNLSPGTKTFLAHLALISSIVMIVGGGLMFFAGTIKSVQTIVDVLKLSKLIDGVTRFGTAIQSINPTLLHTLTIMAGLAATWALVGEAVSIFQMKGIKKETEEWNKQLDILNKRWDERKNKTGKGYFTQTERAEFTEIQKRMAELNEQAAQGGPKWTLENVLGNVKGAVQGMFTGTAEAAEKEIEKIQKAQEKVYGKTPAIPMVPGVTFGKEKGEIGGIGRDQFGIEGYIPALMGVQGGFNAVFKPGMSVINLTIYADDRRVGEEIQRELNKRL